MPEKRESPKVYCFGPFRLDASRELLYKHGEVVNLGPRVLRALLILVENRGVDLDKRLMMEQLWPATIVEEGNLSVIVSTLRKALGEKPGEHKYILTVPGRGYRFVGHVTPCSHEGAQSSGETATEAVVEDPRSSPPRADGRRAQAFWTRARAIGYSVCGSVLILLVSSGVRIWERAYGGAAQTLAVLPFKSLGPGSGDDYLGLVMADALVMRLKGVHQLLVRPSTVSVKYQNAAYDPRRVGQDLGVAALLEGDVQRHDDTLQMKARLLRAKDGLVLWSGNYVGRFGDIVALQDRIAIDVLRALALKPQASQAIELTQTYMGNREAYQIYLQGRYFESQRTLPDLENAIGYFLRAVEKDPRFARAFADLARCYIRMSYHVSSAKSSLLKAKSAAQKALEIDDSLAEAHFAFAYATMYLDWDYASAETHYRRALELEPGNATAHQGYSEYLLALGRTEQAEGEIRRALELDPAAFNSGFGSGYIYFYSRRYREAAALLQASQHVDPNAAWNLIWIQESIRQEPKGEVPATERALGVDAGRCDAYGLYVYALRNLRARAESCLRQLQPFDAVQLSPYHVALVYTALGDRQEAFRWLTQAREDRSWLIVYLNVDPRLDPLRNDARFGELLKSIRLQQ